jgi:REP-associated tyrosine transposase
MVIFRDDRDGIVYLRMLAAVVERFAWSCHAFCLMPNHVHLVVETIGAALSRGMSRLNGRY